MQFLPVARAAECADMQALFWPLRAHRLPLLCVATCSSAAASLLQRKAKKQTSGRQEVPSGCGFRAHSTILQGWKTQQADGKGKREAPLRRCDPQRRCLRASVGLDFTPLSCLLHIRPQYLRGGWGGGGVWRACVQHRGSTFLGASHAENSLEPKGHSNSHESTAGKRRKRNKLFAANQTYTEIC